jgi:hypothetical protein
MPRNPSELQRLEEERLDLLRMLKTNRVPPHSAYTDKGLKSAKEAMLRELRQIERTLGIESIPYNSTKFGEQFVS